MRRLTAYKLTEWIWLALLTYMPFHLFLSRWLSLYTGGLGVWEVGKDILTLIGTLLAGFVAVKHHLYKDKWLVPIALLSAAYLLVHLTFALFNRNLYLHAALIATIYNGRLFAYLLMGIVVGKVKDQKFVAKTIRLLLIASTLTALFALVQYVLPKDLMTHFGYSFARGVKPAFFIDDKPDFPRVMSTLRDPNSYGAYLVLPIVLLWVFINKKKQKLLPIGLFLLHILALFLTFSRGAWLGALLALAIATYFLYDQSIKVFAKKYIAYLFVSGLILIGLGVGLRNQYVIQNVILHKDQHTVATDPNQLRLQFQKQAVKDIIKQPLGYGPGTAGIVSIGNPKGGLLTENYYLQIAYEVGLLGFAIFMTVFMLIYLRLYKLVRSPLSVSLLASFWGYAFISLLIHLWSNEAVAAQWWLLAGLVAGLPLAKDRPLFMMNKALRKPRNTRRTLSVE